jgi:hypothetical protein
MVVIQHFHLLHQQAVVVVEVGKVIQHLFYQAQVVQAAVAVQA